MGPCASSVSPRQRTSLPLTFQSQPLSQGSSKTVKNDFLLRLSNVCLVPVHTANVKLTFVVDGIDRIPFEKSEMVCQRYTHPQLPNLSQKYELKWNNPKTTQLSLNDKELREKNLVVKMMYDDHPEIELLKVSLYLIVNGPYHHNLQIPFGNQVFRVLFDAKISHIFEANLSVKSLKINTTQKVNFSSCHFTLKAMHQDQVIENSAPSYPIIRSQWNPTLDEDEELQKTDTKTPSRIRIHHSFSVQQPSTNQLYWAKVNSNLPSDKLMPSLTFDISSNQVTKYFILLIVWSSNQKQKTANYICEAKLPIWKMFDKQFIEEHLGQSQRAPKNQQQTIEYNKVRMTEKLYKHQDIFGSCDISIKLVAQKIIEQSKYCSRTQEGIVNMRPASLHKNIKSNSKTIHQLWTYSGQIEQILKKASENRSEESVQSQILEVLTKITDKLSTSDSEVLYADVDKNESLVNNQNILINMMQKMIPFIENTQNPFVSQACWSIIINILKRSQFNLENLSLKGSFKTTQALAILNKKKEMGLKYQQMLFRLIYYALKGYGRYQNDNSMLTYFLSFSYFRVPLFREYFLKVINFDQNYSQMQQRLLVFQREIQPNTSFTRNFAELKGDWKSNFYDELKSMSRSVELSSELEGNFKSKKWFMEMSYRDQTMYDFISLLFQSLTKDSAEKADKWKYIEGYSQIVAVVMAELKLRDVSKYNLGLIRSSIQMLQNEHLISPMLPLVCDKINVYQSDNVGVALQLIDEYLDMITKKNTTQVPLTFNHNYFFKVIKSILQSEHYSNISRLLIILYTYFDYFSQPSKYQISMFFLGQSFFKLYYHWSKDIRRTFYMLLMVKIKHLKHQKSTQITNQFNKAIRITKIVEKVHSSNSKSAMVQKQKLVHKKMSQKIRGKFRTGTSVCTNKSKSQFALDSIMKLLDDDLVFGDGEKTSHHEHSPTTPKKVRKAPSPFGEQLQAPIMVSHWSSSKPLGEESDLLSKSDVMPESFDNIKKPPHPQASVRKKRRPSITIEALDKKYQPKIANSLHELSELSEGQIKHISVAKQQMAQVVEQINKFTDSEGKLPKNQLLHIKEDNIKG